MLDSPLQAVFKCEGPHKQCLSLLTVCLDVYFSALFTYLKAIYFFLVSVDLIVLMIRIDKISELASYTAS